MTYYINLGSKRFRASSQKKLGVQKQKRNVEGGGGGEAKGKQTLAREPHDFEKLRLPKNAFSSWRGITASCKPQRPKYGGKFVPHLTRKPLFKFSQTFLDLKDMSNKASQERIILADTTEIIKLMRRTQLKKRT